MEHRETGDGHRPLGRLGQGAPDSGGGTTEDTARVPCHYVTFSDLSYHPAGGRLNVYCPKREEHMEREHDLVLEGEWDAAFIRLVMAHSVFTAAEREGVWFATAL